MRAKTINEVMRFELGLNPKAAMSIGGVVLEDAYNQILKDPINKWEKFITKTLIGKRVSGSFLKFGTQDDGSRGWYSVENVTFRINNIKSWENNGDIDVIDDEDNVYCIKLDQKIHIG